MSEILVNTIKKADGTGSLTVPADTGTVLTSATALSNFPSGFANGITHANHWAIDTASAVGTGTSTLTANWTEVSGRDSVGKLGTGMSESSGVFTFPVTGVWRIDFIYVCTTSAASNYHGAFISVSLDGGSTFTEATQTWNGSIGSSAYVSTGNNFILDVTDTSLIKVRFQIENQVTGTIQGSTGVTRTSATFVRLGDT